MHNHLPSRILPWESLGQGLQGEEGRKEKGGAEGQQSCPDRVTATHRASPLLLPLPCQQVPRVEDIDKEDLDDPYANAEYAQEIFEYMREREVGDACPGSDSPGRGRIDCRQGLSLPRGSAHLAEAWPG